MRESITLASMDCYVNHEEGGETVSKKDKECHIFNGNWENDVKLSSKTGTRLR